MGMMPTFFQKEIVVFQTKATLPDAAKAAARLFGQMEVRVTRKLDGKWQQDGRNYQIEVGL